MPPLPVESYQYATTGPRKLANATPSLILQAGLTFLFQSFMVLFVLLLFKWHSLLASLPYLQVMPPLLKCKLFEILLL